jgi:hypothetical protein
MFVNFNSGLISENNLPPPLWGNKKYQPMSPGGKKYEKGKRKKGKM